MEVYIKDASFDKDGSIIRWQIDWGDGSPLSVLESPATTPGFIVNHTYATTGPYTITLTVTDNTGQTANYSETIDRTGLIAPVPVMRIGTELSGSPGSSCSPVDVDAVGSGDADGVIEKFVWNWGDGTDPTVIDCVGGGCSGAASHQYEEAGEKTITLTVTDDDGNTAGVSRQHTIALNSPPAGVISVNATGTTATPTRVTGIFSVDIDNNIVSWSWDWGDGTDPTVESTPNGESPTEQTHQYSTTGEKTITLTLTDDCGAIGVVSAIVDIYEVVAAIGISPAVGPPDNRIVDTLAVEFDGSASFSGNGTIESYEWDFGDGETLTENTPGGTTPSVVHHEYDDWGDYTVSLTVTNSFTNEDTSSRDFRLIATPNTFFVICDTPTCI